METPFKRIGSVTFSYDGELGLSKEQTAKIKQIVVEPFHDMERPASSVPHEVRPRGLLSVVLFPRTPRQ